MDTDESAFAALVDRHRRELHVHCYRMLGSFPDAEDLVQETFLRAWRNRDGLPGATGLRPWLYRIATNACIDAIRTRARRTTRMESFAEVPWLTPYPDRLLDEIAPSETEPDAMAVARETIELAFLAVLQLLPGQQRALVVLRDVLGWSAKESASILGISVAAANSALQRARATLRDRLPDHDLHRSATADLTEVEKDLLARYVDAHSRSDTAALIALVHEDLRVTMPPHPLCYQGIASMAPLLELAYGADREGDWRLVATRANRQPAAACYLRRPGDTVFRAHKLDLLRVTGDAIAEFTTFDARLFPVFGLAPTL